MSVFRNLLIMSALVFSLSACSSMSKQNKELVGTGTGAVVGGVVGDAVFGSPVGMIAGAAAGGIAGNVIGQHYD